VFRCAHRANCNAIIERNHRTVKSVAARGRFSPEYAVFLYNTLPKDGVRQDSVPAIQLYKYEWRNPSISSLLPQRVGDGRFELGQRVWVKPRNVTCTSEWSQGTVTAVNSDLSIDIDGIPRHISDVRSLSRYIPLFGEENDEGTPETITSDPSPEPTTRPVRQRRLPAWTADFEM